MCLWVRWKCWSIGKVRRWCATEFEEAGEEGAPEAVEFDAILKRWWRKAMARKVRQSFERSGNFCRHIASVPHSNDVSCWSFSRSQVLPWRPHADREQDVDVHHRCNFQRWITLVVWLAQVWLMDFNSVRGIEPSCAAWKNVQIDRPSKCTKTHWFEWIAERCARSNWHTLLIDGRIADHLGAADGLKTLSIHVCVCPHFGM